MGALEPIPPAPLDCSSELPRRRRAPLDRPMLERAIRRAAPLIRERLAALEDARWRGAHRDRLSRRLIPWVLAAARRAATERRHADLTRLDGLVSRLAFGMTAGEELGLEDLLARRARSATCWPGPSACRRSRPPPRRRRSN